PTAPTGSRHSCQRRVLTTSSATILRPASTRHDRQEFPSGYGEVILCYSESHDTSQRRHCEQSEAIQGQRHRSGSLRRCAPRDDGMSPYLSASIAARLPTSCSYQSPVSPTLPRHSRASGNPEFASLFSEFHGCPLSRGMTN